MTTEQTTQNVPTTNSLSEVERLVKRSLKFSTVRPSPPREVVSTATGVSWKPPQVITQITHYNVRVGTDGGDPSYQVPVGQTMLQLTGASGVCFVSSWNANSKLESQRVKASSPQVSLATKLQVGPVTAVQVDTQAQARFTITYDAPLLLGSGDLKFAGVEVYLESPNGTVIDAGWTDYTGIAGGQGTAQITLPYPPTSGAVIVYLASGSQLYTNNLVRLPNAGATPNISVTLPAGLTGGAPNVSLFKAGTAQPDGTFTALMRWDTLNESLLIDWACLAPASFANWSDFAIYIKTAAGVYAQASDFMSSHIFVGGAAHGTVQIAPTLIPNPVETWTIIAVSRDRYGNPNLDGGGNPTGPTVSLVTLAASTPVNFTAPSNVTGLSFTAANTIGLNRQLIITYTPPATGPFLGCQFYISTPGLANPADLGIVDTTGTGIQTVTLYYPAPASAETWTVYAVSYSANVTNKLITGLGASPSATAAVAIFPTAPLVTSLVVAVSYPAAADGSKQAHIVATFGTPNDPRFGGVEMVAYDGTNYTTLTHVKTSPAVADVPVPTSVVSWTIYLVSINATNIRNPIDGGTPNAIIAIGSASGTFDPRKYDPSTTSTLIVSGGLLTVKSGGALSVDGTGAVIISPGGVQQSHMGANAVGNSQVDRVSGNALIIVNGDLAANCVWANNIITNAVSSAKLDATEISVGGGGNKPGRFGVYNASGTNIGFIGVDGSGNQGGWFKTLAVGGSSYSTAPLQADGSGNVTLTNATLTNSNGAGDTLTIGQAGSGWPVVSIKGATYGTFIYAGNVYVGPKSGTGACYAQLTPNIIALTDPTYGGVAMSTSGTGTTQASFQGGTYNLTIRADVIGGVTVTVNGSQILSARKTGWTAATGTATRTSFATGSVTLPALAAALKALLDDLLSHGLIGA